MSIGQTAWVPKTVNGFLVLTCTITGDASLYDAYTLKTPANTVDGTKPFTIFQSAASTPDGSALPFHVWIGYDDDFALSGDAGSLVAASGSFYVELTEDCRLAVTTVQHAYHIHPNLRVADVVVIGSITAGYKANVPPAPYYALCLNGASQLAAIVTTFRIVQKQ